MQTSKAVYKILLIDDDTDFVAATKTVLESRSDYQLFTTSDGLFALSTANCEG